ncbi:MAG: N-acetyl-gamma-glutamyl-phosphate reductase [Pseudobdellovibrionaceae bacterium]
MMNNKAAEIKTQITNSNVPTVSIVGARGYSGLELAKLLFKHPAVKLTHAFATKSFSLSDDLFETEAASVSCLPEDQLMQNLTDIVFLATPAEVSLKLAPEILAQGKKVIDLSGAFRLKKNDYQKWYHFEHTSKETLMSAQYGLVPFAKPATRDIGLIANPGCFATAISMALIPLLKKNLIMANNLVIDAKSGTTGAGKKAVENLLFSEVAGNCLPYRIGQHQHYPEIQEAVEMYTGVQIEPHFSTHLLPTQRGIIASIYATSLTDSLADIEAAFSAAYQNNPLVKYGANIAKLAKLTSVEGTAKTHISYQLVDRKLYVFSVIDNLMKGAASQAVENLNRLLDLPPQYSLAGTEAQ